jgi:hypothetical protein
MMFHPRTAEPRANEGAAANRHLPLASAERRDCSFIGLACRARRLLPVAEFDRSAASACWIDALRLGVFASLRLSGAVLSA